MRNIKSYSLFFFLLAALLFNPSVSAQLLDVEGGIVLSDSDSTKEGLIKWTGIDFLGYDGTNWRSLTDTGIITTSTDSLYIFNYDTTYAFLQDTFGYIFDADRNTYIYTGDGSDDEIEFVVGGQEFLNMTLNSNGQYQFEAETGPGGNLYFGENSGKLSNTTSLGRNTAFGHNALSNVTDGFQNVAIGYNALGANSTGDQNIAIGEDALREGTDNDDNIVLGSNAFLRLNNGNSNIALGNNVALADTSGDENIFIGEHVGYSGSGAGTPAARNDNVVIGSHAGSTDMGSRNVILGHNAGQNFDGDDQLIIENSDSDEPLIYGDFANDSLQLNAHVTAKYAQVGDDATGRKGKLLISHANTHDEPAVRIMENGTSGGRVYFQDTSSSEVIAMHGHSSAGKLRIYFHTESTASAGPKATFMSNGRMAVNGDNPQHTLHVFGDIKAEQTITIRPSPVPPAVFMVGTMWYDGGTNRMRVWDGAVWQPCW